MAKQLPNTPEVEAMAFINGASHFSWGADELHKLVAPGSRIACADAVYVLMAHAVELALKGYLRLQGWPTRKLAERTYGHHLKILFEQAELHGFRVDPEQRLLTLDVVEMLDESNQDQALRYFTLQSKKLPELPWGIRVVQELVAIARQAALRIDPDAEKTGPPVKIDFLFSEPRPQ